MKIDHVDMSPYCHKVVSALCLQCGLYDAEKDECLLTKERKAMKANNG